MFVLPISGVPVRFRALDGHDELVLSESSSSVEARVEAVRRLTPPADPAEDWSRLPFADIDAALLAVRQRTFGDRLVAEILCATCAAWCDTELSVASYLAANRPRRVGGIQRRDNDWYDWNGLRFRAPAVAAVLDISKAAPVEQPRLLLQSCIGADSPEIAAKAKASGRAAARIATLLEKIAPPLAGEVQGSCPHCSEIVRGWFDPGALVLSELRTRASLIFEHVHLLAQAYGWSEDAILALPAHRRAFYANRIQQD